ncbi:phage tail protein [Mucilaginibacter robiniae]|uniref:Phage tail protein n=1 Tax=Mucilaginibacter robiniae TaxID=2728022 RepID=A0A7L5DWU2_9SPHI|nr:tail fiber protein [Mucilaginibacter robiniae]QJD95221.1 phage tail protein [Mucilaginibacter robiniae]
MGDNFLGEIRIFPYNKIPRGWAACDGTIMPIQNNQALFSLITAQFGGDGRVNFALPDLRGRVPLCAGAVPNTNSALTYTQGNPGGANSTTLTINNMPAHSHNVYVVNNPANQSAVEGNFLSEPAGSDNEFLPVSSVQGSLVAMSSSMISPSPGGGNPVSNMQPYRGLVFAIAVVGIYPPQP